MLNSNFKKPNFLCIGVQKSGTTSLIPYLNQHPDIYMHSGEIHFFDKKYDKGIKFYEKHFQTNKKIVANPNCSTAQMVVALKPLHDIAKIRRVVVSTYQSVSGAGKEAMDELWLQTKGIFVPGQEVSPRVFSKQIAFNVIPHIDKFLSDGQTREEWKMAAETRKILDESIKVTATCVRVPVFVGHSEAINIEFENFLDENRAREILRNSPGILVVDKKEDGGYISPTECVGDYATFISRVRQDSTLKSGINIWCVSDNLRKGAALNAVQIAELYSEKIEELESKIQN